MGFRRERVPARIMRPAGGLINFAAAAAPRAWLKLEGWDLIAPERIGAGMGVGLFGLLSWMVGGGIGWGAGAGIGWNGCGRG